MDDALRLARVRELCANGEARRRRQRWRMSLPEVAAAVGVSHPTVLRWETGARMPRGDAALRYGALLDALDAEKVPAHG